jgi:hypothetical protein
VVGVLYLEVRCVFIVEYMNKFTIVTLEFYVLISMYLIVISFRQNTFTNNFLSSFIDHIVFFIEAFFFKGLTL